MSAIDTIRDALFGNPPSPTTKPSREGVLAAFTEMQASVVAVTNDAVAYPTVGDLPAVTAENDGDRARVFDDPTPENNTYWIVKGGDWDIDADYIASVATIVQPLVEAAEDAKEAAEKAAEEAALSGGNTIDVPLANYFLAFSGNGTASGVGNTTAGHRAGEAVSSGANNTFYGFNSGLSLTTGIRNLAAGSGALRLNVSGNRNTAVGYNALNTYLADDATAVGANALTLATGSGHTAVGSGAGSALTTGLRGVWIGVSAGGNIAQDATANDCIVIGYNAASTGNGQIVLGSSSQDWLKMFGQDFARYVSSTNNMTLGGIGNTPSVWTGSHNLGVGRANFSAATTASNMTAFGLNAMESVQTGANSLAMGTISAQFATSITDCVYVGSRTGRYVGTGVGATGVGYRSLEHGAVANGNTALGDSSLWHTQGFGNTAAGYTVGEAMSQGDNNVLLGRAAGRYRDNGNDMILIGVSAGAITSNAGSTNVVEVSSPTEAIGGAAAGSRIIGIGRYAIEECLGSDVVAIGHGAGRSLVGTVDVSMDSIFIGNGAGDHEDQKADASNQIVIGPNAFAERDDEIVIGNSGHDFVTIAGVEFTRAQIEALKALVA